MTVSPGSGPQDFEESRRYLIAASVSRYPKCPDWDRPGLVEARERIVELFTKNLGYRHHTALGADPTVQQLREQLRAFCTAAERREDDLVVVYLSGHGEVDETSGEHVLLMSDTDPADVSFTSLPTAELVRVFSGTRVRRLLLILDTCYSGQGGNELAAAALERLGATWGQSTASPGLVIVSSAQPHQQAKAGLFPDLLDGAVNRQATAGHAPKHLSVSAVVQQMNDDEAKPAYQRISLSLIGLTGEPPDFLSNPRHDVRLTDVDLVLQDAAEFDEYARRRDTEFTSRLLVRAMGYHGDAAQGWWFCGRHRVLAELSAWLRTGDEDRRSPVPGDPVGAGPVRVVTAGPGSGKTAVLGLIAALALPERRRTVPIGSLGLDPEWIPGEGSIDVIMYAQNLTNGEVLHGLAAAAGLKASTVGEFLDDLGQQTSARARPFTVLIDALDEAATPDSLCSQVVRPLIDHSQGRIRLLLGTRPYLLDRLGLDTAIPDRDSRVLDLDSTRYADRQALRVYTMRNLIESRHTSPYRQRPDLLEPVASAVADAADRSFLVARLAAYTLASSDTVVTDPRDPQWQAGLPSHAGQAMRDDLTSRLGHDAQRAADLLRPLAYAEGQGLPWEDIWAPLASAISGRIYTDDDLLWLRRNAGSYVVEATENGRSSYRLYHQALTEHLREDTDPAAIHSAFVDILTARVPYRGDATRDWSRAHPYTLNHLATHAAAAHRIDDLLTHTEYLVHAAPHSLTPHLHQASGSRARLTAAVYRTSFDLHADASPPVRRNLLALNAARAGATSLQEQLNNCAHTSPWVPAWATGHDFTPALRHSLTGHHGQAQAVACAVLDGRPVAVIATNTGTGTGTGTGRVYVWDLATGRPVGDPFASFDRRVHDVACAVLDGRPVAVIATSAPFDTGRVYVWDLATGRPVAEPLASFDQPVQAVACTVLDGRPVAVISTGALFDTGAGRMYVWDLATGGQVGEFSAGVDDPVGAVACTVLDGRPVAVAVIGTDALFGSDVVIGLGAGRVYVWDLATGDQVGEFSAGVDDPVGAVACTVLDGRPVAVIATGTSTGSVRVWDLDPDGLVGAPFASFDRQVRAVACTVLDGRPVAVIATATGRVSVCDLAAGGRVGEPRAVCAVACTVLDGRPVAVIATGAPFEPGAGGMYVWDLATGGEVGELSAGADAPVGVVACTVLDGRPVAVIATSNFFDPGRMYLWDLATEHPVAKPFTRFDDPVEVVACTVLDGRPVAVIATATATATGTGTGTGTGTVYVWDLATGRPVAEPLASFDQPVQAVACTVLDDRPVAVIAAGPLFETGAGRVYVWDLATGGQVGEPFASFDRRVRAVACTVLDGRPLAVIGTFSNDLHLWDIRARKALCRFVIPGLRAVDFSSDGSLVVALERDLALLAYRSDKLGPGSMDETDRR
ncbi:caspase family protein [Streptomyces sp. NPDC001443]